jgi:hypothetical protein
MQAGAVAEGVVAQQAHRYLLAPSHRVHALGDTIHADR